MMIASGLKVGNMYSLYVSSKNSILSVIELPNVALWHSQLGHISRMGMETLSCLGYLLSLSYSDFPYCEHCQYGKQTQNSHNVHFEKDRKPLELMHSDIYSPMLTHSLGSI